MDSFLGRLLTSITVCLPCQEAVSRGGGTALELTRALPESHNALSSYKAYKNPHALARVKCISVIEL